MTGRVSTGCSKGDTARSKAFRPEVQPPSELAAAAAKAGLIHFEHGGSVSLTEKGQKRGAGLKPLQ